MRRPEKWCGPDATAGTCAEPLRTRVPRWRSERHPGCVPKGSTPATGGTRAGPANRSRRDAAPLRSNRPSLTRGFGRRLTEAACGGPLSLAPHRSRGKALARRIAGTAKPPGPGRSCRMGAIRHCPAFSLARNMTLVRSTVSSTPETRAGAAAPIGLLALGAAHPPRRPGAPSCWAHVSGRSRPEFRVRMTGPNWVPC